MVSFHLICILEKNCLNVLIGKMLPATPISNLPLWFVVLPIYGSIFITAYASVLSLSFACESMLMLMLANVNFLNSSQTSVA